MGPPGTFSEEALEQCLGSTGARRVPLPSLSEVLRAVQKGHVTAGLVPIENSLEGSVNVTLDLLAHEVDLILTGEIALPVRHCLLGRRGQGKGIARILSHPQALAQCREYLTSRFPQAIQQPVESTGRAAVLVAQEMGEGTAAIGGLLAARLYGLEVLAEGIEDRPNNMTRFVLLGKRVPPPTGRDKTSLVFTTAHRPGCLYRVLGEFANRDLNLTRIESRPAKHSLGEYIFFVDIEGHREDPPVAAALTAVRSQCTFFKFLGSYPRWNGG